MKPRSLRRYVTVVWLGVGLLCSDVPENGIWGSRAWAAEPSAGTSGVEAGSEPSTESTNAVIDSEADLVLGLQAGLERDTKELEGLRAEYDSPDSEYHKAEEALAQVSKELEELGAKAEQASTGGQAMPEEIQSAIEQAQTRESLAKQRFETAFEERKALREKITVLEKNVEQSRDRLAKLRDGEDVGAGATNVVSETVAAPVQAGPTNGPEVSLPGPAGVVSAAVASQATSTNAPPPAAQGEELRPTRQLLEARQEVAAKQEEAQEAQEELGLFRERYLNRKRELEVAETLVESARKKADVALQQRSVLQKELESKRAEGATAEVVAELEQQIAEAETRVQAARDQMEEQQTSVRELQEIVARLDQLEQTATEEAEAKQKEVSKAEGTVKFLENPLHPQNLLRWLRSHGPKLIGIVLLMIVANLLIRLLNHRIVKIAARSGSHGTPEERESRAYTLVSVFRSSASLLVFAGGALMILDQCGVPVGPLLGGAAILGLAIAFGAQRLIGDFFHGFVILMENQYKVNDVIRVAGIAGLVERITLRVTILRDLEGCLHFVPNGEIKAVTNMTHGWSRALFEIGVAYKEDADRVMEVLMELANELRRDPKFGSLILDEPQMLGLDAMADSAIVIKFFVKTRPLQQWTVKRELLRRIKKRFDELGIEIPFPQRTVYLRSEANGGETVAGTGLEERPFKELRRS